MKKLKARIENGDEKDLQNFRKKIIDELKEKDPSRRNKFDDDNRRNRRDNFRAPIFDAHRRNNNSRFFFSGNSSTSSPSVESRREKYFY
jgi:hypothetical protein